MAAKTPSAGSTPAEMPPPATVIELLVPPDTRRLRFRPVVAEDQEAIARIYHDPQARRFLPHMDKADGVQHFITRQLQRYQDFGYGIWLLEARDDGRVVGDAGLTWQETDRGQVLEVGYGLAEPERGKGYATEAASACLDFAFDVLGATLVASLVHRDNAPSRAVAERVHAAMRAFVHPELGEDYLLYYTRSGDRDI